MRGHESGVCKEGAGDAGTAVGEVHPAGAAAAQAAWVLPGYRTCWGLALQRVVRNCLHRSAPLILTPGVLPAAPASLLQVHGRLAMLGLTTLILIEMIVGRALL